MSGTKEILDIIVLGFNDWHEWEAEGFRTRTGMLIKKFSERPDCGKILVISTARSFSINTWRLLKSRTRGSRRHRASVRPFRVRQVAEKVFVLDHTRLFPREQSYGLFYQLNGLMHDGSLRKAVCAAAGKLGMKAPVLWVSNPLMAKHMGHLGESLSIFDAIDDWELHPQKQRMTKSIREGYRLVRERANLIFAVSQTLAERLGEGRDHSYWQPNAVDADFFAGEFKVPPEVDALPRPVVGYVGVLQERIDVDLLRALANALPTGSIVIVGPIVAPGHFEGLDSISNIHFIGKRPYSQIPAYLHAFDLCIVPHLENDFTHSMNPLKVYEYLAVGKPVVASGLAGFEEAGDLVCQARSPSDFISAAQFWLEPPDAQVDERRAFARRHSWDQRIDEMFSYVRALREREWTAA